MGNDLGIINNTLRSLPNNKNMTELKTLKDLEFETMVFDNREDEENTDADSMNIVEVEEIKQEAIKWVKFWSNTRLKSKSKSDIHRLEHKIDAFTNFFNLTEEDLQ